MSSVITDISETIDSDWVTLAHNLGITEKDILKIQLNHPYAKDQALAALDLWRQTKKASKQELEESLKRSGRSDIVSRCLYKTRTTETVTSTTHETKIQVQTSRTFVG